MEGAFFYGLPEQKIDYLEMKHVRVNYDVEAKSGQPAMMDGIPEEICKMGIFARNVDRLVLEDVEVSGQSGKEIDIDGINSCIKDGTELK